MNLVDAMATWVRAGISDAAERATAADPVDVFLWRGKLRSSRQPARRRDRR